MNLDVGRRAAADRPSVPLRSRRSSRHRRSTSRASSPAAAGNRMDGHVEIELMEPEHVLVRNEPPRSRAGAQRGARTSRPRRTRQLRRARPIHVIRPAVRGTFVERLPLRVKLPEDRLALCERSPVQRAPGATPRRRRPRAGRSARAHRACSSSAGRLARHRRARRRQAGRSRAPRRRAVARSPGTRPRPGSRRSPTRMSTRGARSPYRCRRTGGRALRDVCAQARLAGADGAD